MFNEILTGKGTLEPPPATTPYRTESVPQIQRTCFNCTRTFMANVGTPETRPCPSCAVVIAQAVQRENARMARDMEQRFAKQDNTNRLLKWGVWGVIVVGLGVAKVAIRSEQREASARYAGYTDYAEYESLKDKTYPSDDFSYRVNAFADQMCSCRDRACAADVQAQYLQHIRRNRPSDDQSSASAANDADRLAQCAAALEPTDAR